VHKRRSVVQRPRASPAALPIAHSSEAKHVYLRRSCRAAAYFGCRRAVSAADAVCPHLN
jgi:hypothetical protein